MNFLHVKTDSHQWFSESYLDFFFLILQLLLQLQLPFWSNLFMFFDIGFSFGIDWICGVSVALEVLLQVWSFGEKSKQIKKNSKEYKKRKKRKCIAKLVIRI